MDKNIRLETSQSSRSDRKWSMSSESRDGRLRCLWDAAALVETV